MENILTCNINSEFKFDLLPAECQIYKHGKGERNCQFKVETDLSLTYHA